MSIALLILTFAIPLYIFNQHQNDSASIYQIQKIVFLALLCGSIMLTYINNKTRIQIKKFTWLWITFEVIGVLGIIYSGFVLYLIFALRNIGY